MKLSATIKKLTAGIPLKWVALGDSLTYGWMVNKGYLDFLSDMIIQKYPEAKPNIHNRGIPGDTADGGLRRLKEHVLSIHPDVVSVQFGLNDLFVGYTVEQFAVNIQKIIARIKTQCCCEILLMTSVAISDPLENAQARAFYNAIINISQHESLPCARVHEYWERAIALGRRWEELVQADGVHPTEEGYRLMAEAIMEVL